MAKKVGKLKSVISVVLAVLVETIFINLPILCAINGVGILESFHDIDIVVGLIFGLVFGLGVGRLVSGLVLYIRVICSYS